MPGHLRQPQYLILAGALCLMAILAAELALSVRHESPTWNEPDHLLAGYRYWQCRDFAVNNEHPPLVKWLAAIPLLPLRLQVPQLPQGPSKLEANRAGRKFLYANGGDVFLFRARLAAMALTLLLAALLLEAAWRVFGPEPALLALFLFVSEPNLLAHGALVTTDMGLTCCMFAAVYAFYRYARQPSRLNLAECGFMLGLAFAAKHSGIFAVPILALLASTAVLAEHPLRSQSGPPAHKKLTASARRAFRLAAALMVMVGIGLAVLWAFYGFRFRARPGNQALSPSLTEFVQGLEEPAQARAILKLARWRVLPESYLYGLADVLDVSAGPRPTFLLGKLYPRGRWFYFPAAFLIKSTLGFLALLLISLFTKTLFRPEIRREVLFFAIPPAAYLAFSMTSGLNIGVRHILPIYPFLLILAAVGAWNLIAKRRAWAYIVAAFLGLHVFSTWHAFPNYLAYSNEFCGGPGRTYRVLTDSNVDWGQGLEAAKDYLDRRGTQDCWMAYFGSGDPAHYQIPCKLLPDPYSRWWGDPVEVAPQAVQGTVLISATELAGTYWGPGELNPYEQFLRTRPAANIAGCILVFQGRFDVRLASALSHANKAWELIATRHLDQALAEARTAVGLAPRSVYAQYALGYALNQTKQRAEARRAYQTALALAETVYPDFQSYWIPFLRNQLSHP
jgi:hypothetical protein